jgi:serine/threonine-protein kinase HipA
MPRRRAHVPLAVRQNGRLVGRLLKQGSGAIEFRYDDSWLARTAANPVSLSLPLSEQVYRGAPVVAVFENLLPDSDGIRRQVAERMGAEGTDAYSLLRAIGRDCVGALQFLAEDDLAPGDTAAASPLGIVLDDGAVEHLLIHLSRAPLGLRREDDFRISVAGAQEKTALLLHEGRWLKPTGSTPTTHIFKTQIGVLPGGIDLSDSVENEYFCLKCVEAFGLPVNRAAPMTFGGTKVLVIERFDRLRQADGLWLRLPQEDCCQALSVPPTRKYESEGGPGMLAILDLLSGSDTAAEDRRTFFMAQVLFWLLGATDGHAKNFSLHLVPGGGYRLTPLYDILSVQPAIAARRVERKQMRLAMAVGDSRHYRLHEISARHFVQTGEAAGLPKASIREVLDRIGDTAEAILSRVRSDTALAVPEAVSACIADAAIERARALTSR